MFILHMTSDFQFSGMISEYTKNKFETISGIYFTVESHKCTGNIHSVYYVVLCLLPNS